MWCFIEEEVSFVCRSFLLFTGWKHNTEGSHVYPLAWRVWQWVKSGPRLVESLPILGWLTQTGQRAGIMGRRSSAFVCARAPLQQRHVRTFMDEQTRGRRVRQSGSDCSLILTHASVSSVPRSLHVSEASKVGGRAPVGAQRYCREGTARHMIIF